MNVLDEWKKSCCQHCGAKHLGACFRIKKMEVDSKGAIKAIEYRRRLRLPKTYLKFEDWLNEQDKESIT